MESGVLRDEREPEAPAPSGRVHRESGRPPPLRGDLTLIWMGRGMATLSLSSDFPRRRRGPDTTLRFKRSASLGPLFRVGITKKPRGKATLINLSFPLVPFPHAVGVGPTLHCA